MKEVIDPKSRIVIIGAGPGGCTTALALAKKGIESVVIDKASFPRDKVGGDVFPGIILRALHEIDPVYVEKLAELTCLHEIHGTKLIAPNLHELTIKYRNIDIGDYLQTTSCYAGRRLDLDQFLIEEIQSNARIQLIQNQAIDDFEYEEGRVRLFSKDRSFEISGKLVVLACGANAPILTKMTSNRQEACHRGVGLRAYFKGVKQEEGKNYAELYFLNNLLPGIFYLTPLPNGLTNVNVGTREDVLKKKQLKLKDILINAIQQHPILKEKFQDAVMVDRMKGWSLPFATQKKQLYGTRFLLVGDAGSLIDFTSGNGIGSAMYSGLFAADKIEACFREKNFSASFLSDYQQAVEQKMAKHLKMGKMIAPFFGFTSLHGVYKILINQIIKRASNSTLFTELMYNKQIEKELKSFSFYWRMLSKR